MPAIPITVTGNLTGDPELRFTATGKPVATLSVAVNERVKSQDGTWGDGPTSYVRCTAWQDQAEHIAESLGKGDRVIVSGFFRERAYEVEPANPKDSGKRRAWELVVNDIGPSLKYATRQNLQDQARPQRTANPR
jgi:single-strand DNA-binding protein